MRKILIVIMILLTCNLSSCYRHIYVPVENNSVSNSKELVYMRDSIYIKDSIVIGDTVREYHKEYKYKTYIDTFYSIDSVYNEVPVEVEVIKAVIPQWCYYCLVVIALIVFFFVFKIIKYFVSNQFSFFK